MLTRIGQHVSPALVLSLVALFITVGGVAWAVKKAPKNSVIAKSIKSGAVTTGKIRDGAVNGAKVADGSLAGADIGDGSLTGEDLKDGSVGAAKLDPTLDPLWAVVRADGTLVRASNPAITSTVAGGGGDTTVNFGRNVSACAWVASIGQDGNVVPLPGEVLTTLTGDPAVVYVDQRSSAGADGAGNARPFMIAVHC